MAREPFYASNVARGVQETAVIFWGSAGNAR